MNRRTINIGAALLLVAALLSSSLSLARNVPPTSGRLASNQPAANKQAAVSQQQVNPPTLRLTNPQRSDDGAGRATIAETNLPSYTIDMAALGIKPQPNKPSDDLTDGNALGSQNAFMSISPDVVRPNTTSAAVTLASGFTPAENVQYYLGGALAGTFVASAQGRLAVALNTGSAEIYITVTAIGVTSGKVAGGNLLISNNAVIIPGVAVAPHAAAPGTTNAIGMFGTGYPASTVVTLTRNTTILGTVTTAASGRFNISVNLAAGADTSAVYSAFITGVAGSRNGQTVEERADAGTGDQNVARAFVSRAVMPSTTGGGTTASGEGFQAGETVNLSGCTIGSLTAGANGEVGAFFSVPAVVATYNCVFTGATSARVARFTILAETLVPGVSNAIVAPSSRAVTNIRFYLANQTPNITGTLFIDGVNSGTVNIDSGGFGVTTVPLPGPSPFVHSYVFFPSNGTPPSIATYLAVGPNGQPLPTSTNTATRTNTATATITPGACNGNVIFNGGFETGNFSGWNVSTDPGGTATVISGTPFAGAFHARLNAVPIAFSANATLEQSLTVPASGGTLSVWLRGSNTTSSDSSRAYIVDASSNQTDFFAIGPGQTIANWTNATINLNALAGQTIILGFSVPAADGTNTLDVDEAFLAGLCNSPTATATDEPSNTPVPTNTPTRTNTATATATITPGACNGNVIFNGGFETGNFSGWNVATDPGGTATVISGTPFAGTFHARLNAVPIAFSANATLEQSLTVPAGGGTLSVWLRGRNTTSSDSSRAYIVDANSNETTFFAIGPGQTIANWTNATINLNALAGQTILLGFVVPAGDGANTLDVDEAFLAGLCNSPTATATDEPSNTPVPTNTPTRTNTPTSTPTSTLTNTATRTNTATSTNTATNTATTVPSATNTNTATATRTNTATATNTATTVPSATNTSTATATNTNTATATNTNTATSVPSATSTNTVAPTSTTAPSSTSTTAPSATNTVAPSSTTAPSATNTAVPTAIASAVATSTSVPPTNTSVPSTPAPTATECTINYPDVPTEYWAFGYIKFVTCRGIAQGYADGFFRPNRNISRAEFSKMVAIGFNVPLLTPASPTYSDVPTSYWAYRYIEGLTAAGIVNGFGDGTFRPSNFINRAQMVKMIVVASGIPLLNPPTPSFPDVPTSYWAYRYIETAFDKQWIGGFVDGTFKPNNNATRAELAKLVYLSLTFPLGLERP